jgi:hypothetical protein
MLFRFLTKETETPLICRKKMLLTKEEITFFQQLQKVLPNRLIFPKVTLSSIINLDANSDKKRNVLSKQLDEHKVDYAIYSQEHKLICVIELEQTSINIAHSEDVFRSLPYLDKAGIKSIRWSRNRLPTFEQMCKILVQFSKTPTTSKKKDFSRNTINQTINDDNQFDFTHMQKRKKKIEESEEQKLLLQKQALTEQEHDNPFALPIKTIIQITPDHFVKTRYPHIWQRICLFAPDPPHLKMYLDSLFVQNRIGKRMGLPQEAASEVMRILGENERFIKKGDVPVWSQHPINL